MLKNTTRTKRPITHGLYHTSMRTSFLSILSLSPSLFERLTWEFQWTPFLSVKVTCRFSQQIRKLYFRKVSDEVSKVLERQFELLNPLRANYCHTWHMENHPYLWRRIRRVRRIQVCMARKGLTVSWLDWSLQNPFDRTGVAIHTSECNWSTWFNIPGLRLHRLDRELPRSQWIPEVFNTADTSRTAMA